ncbi:hypothetical protein MUO66_00085 [Candidatus Bathyarchaeota archaeon]|nr:hypothetical protein [Candidatus Bathyarchaeota archaeon]
MNYPTCNKNKCINWKNGKCALKEPEKTNNYCLHFEDSMDSLRLKADAIKGSLS